MSGCLLSCIFVRFRREIILIDKYIDLLNIRFICIVIWYFFVYFRSTVIFNFWGIFRGCFVFIFIIVVFIRDKKIIIIVILYI